MKFILSSLKLLKAVQSLSGVINSNNTLPILDDFLFNISSIDPCGLCPLIANKYGSLPIVFATGGLKDNFSDVINSISLEIMYYLAYKHCKYIFMETEVFGKYYNANEKIPNKEYTGRFTPEIEYYLIDKLNVKKLYE